MLYELLRPVLFRMDPERAHDMVTSVLSRLPLPARSIGPAKTVFGVSFPNPVGLAAGFDKDGKLLRALPGLGFGFVEIGSVTLRPQPGNPRPRLFRFPEHRAVVNRMGFNSEGADAVAERLARVKCAVPLGINLGLNKDGDADSDYAAVYRKLRPYGDYFVINVSSPNTPGLRSLQTVERLRRIVDSVAADKPLLIKLAPDLADADLEPLMALPVAGYVVSNTTVSRPVDVAEQGGLSGAPLRALSTAMVRRVRSLTKLPIIGVGGIFTGADAREKLEAGADLVQLYTAMIYRGPFTALRVQEEL